MMPDNLKRRESASACGRCQLLYVAVFVYATRVTCINVSVHFDNCVRTKRSHALFTGVCLSSWLHSLHGVVMMPRAHHQAAGGCQVVGMISNSCSFMLHQHTGCVID